MGQLEFVRHSFSEFLNSRELRYRNEIQPQEPEFDSVAKWLQRIADGRRRLVPWIAEQVEFRGEILELGAGSCWFGGELSRIAGVTGVYCLEMSEWLLEKVAPAVLAAVGAQAEKVVRVVGDFNRLQFDDRHFDFVVFDAAVHHIPIDAFARVFGEIRRVLRPGGKVVAIREPFLRPIPFLAKRQKAEFGAHERSLGCTENVFTRGQWARMHRQVGFCVRFIPCGLRTDRSLSARNLAKLVVKLTPLTYLFHLLRPSFFMVSEPVAQYPGPTSLPNWPGFLRRENE